MAVDTTRLPWVTQAEAAIRALRDVESATVLGEGEAIREIHVLTRSSRPAKQIVRDVQTVLQTRFSRSIDYRVVSVAYLSPVRTAAPDSSAPSDHARPPAAATAPAPVAPAPTIANAPTPSMPSVAAPIASAPVPPLSTASVAPAKASDPAPPAAAAPPPQPNPTAPAAERRGSAGAQVIDRIRFGNVNLFVSGARTQAQVELRWGGFPRMGSASGWSTRANAHRIVAQATLAAVQEFLADEIALGVEDLEFLRLGRSRVVVVSLSLLVGRQEKSLTGTCTVEQDDHQAVVLATLAALNRVVGSLRPRETTEYILRPTSS